MGGSFIQESLGRCFLVALRKKDIQVKSCYNVRETGGLVPKGKKAKDDIDSCNMHLDSGSSKEGFYTW